MNLLLLLLIPLIGAITALLSNRINNSAPRVVALGSVALTMLPLLNCWQAYADQAPNFVRYQSTWISRFNLDIHFALDGLSLLLVALTLFISLLAILASWQEIKHKQGLFYCYLLLTISGIIGVFTSLNLLIFFVFWEVMLVPLFFLINIWGHEQRHYAALKFLIFTQLGGLLMLLSICGLSVIHLQQTGQWDFDYVALSHIKLSASQQGWLGLGFMLAFLVKLPALPFHSWLPDAHTQAPTGVSILLAAILLKTSAYGIIRFVLVLFPDFSLAYAPIFNTIAVLSIIYGATVAFAQTDLKRLIAYSSISHMGFVLLGCFSFSVIALQGAMIQMIAHGLTSAGLFACAGMIHTRYATRDLQRLGGLSQQLPQLSGLAMVLVIATLGMPGLGNFIGEALVLFGSFEHYPQFSVIAALGLIFSACYCLVIVYRCFWGPTTSTTQQDNVTDVSWREKLNLSALIFALIALGMHPQPVLNLTQQLSHQITNNLTNSITNSIIPLPPSPLAQQEPSK